MFSSASKMFEICQHKLTEYSSLRFLVHILCFFINVVSDSTDPVLIQYQDILPLFQVRNVFFTEF